MHLFNIVLVSIVLVAVTEAKDVQKQYLQTILDNLDESCIQNVDDSSERAVALSAKESFKSCFRVETMAEMKQLLVNLGPHSKQPNVNIDTSVQAFCEKVSHVSECFQAFVQSVLPCLEEADKLNFRLMNATNEAINSYVCGEDGKKFIEFINDKGMVCVFSNVRGIAYCTSNVKAKFAGSPTTLFGDQKCKGLLSLQSCITNQLQYCEKPSTVSFVDGLLGTVIAELSCERHSDSDESAL